VIATGPDSRKVKNVRANPKGAVTIGGDPVNDHERYAVGYLFQREWSLEGEPGFEWIRKTASATGPTMSGSSASWLTGDRIRHCASESARWRR